MSRRVINFFISALVIIAILVVLKPFEKDIWDVNAHKLRKSFQPISGSAIIDDFSEWVPFEWDRLYSFPPYTSKEIIYEAIGYKWEDITETLDEGMNQVIFIKDGKVVCYIHGYPHKNKLSFNFGPFVGGYFKLTNEPDLTFETTYNEEGQIRYFDYIR